ncbi:beta-1-3-galactosyltransferase 1-like [Brachionus plicatilis]|uniref:Hexosyltransferase n=1 Tax=Brachionus plicatilis TaxID=10195 RepID=A0A3M7SH04_BRAPC|nr:beta-1-3-galactosyltransferase 1-like [Brachionus plicatilis]
MNRLVYLTLLSFGPALIESRIENLEIKTSTETTFTSTSESTSTLKTTSPDYVPFWVKPQKVKPVLNPKSVCLKNQGENVDILLYSLTRMDDFKTRLLIRQTWANKTTFPFSELLFVLGQSINETLNRLVYEENENYGDIYQSDFIDTYKNLSYKSITAWRWISKNCMNAKLIVRSDDDMIVNLEAIHSDQMKNLIPLSNTFTCLYLDRSYALRDRNHKYYMPRIEFNETFYKIYCDGRGTIMSTDLIPKLYNYSYVNNNLWIDDANVGAIASYFKPNFKFIGNKYIEKWQISHQGCERDLGVIVSNDLEYEKQVEYSVAKASKMLGIVRRTFVYYDSRIAKLTYSTFERPHLEYAIATWNTRKKSKMSLIERVQHRATNASDISHLCYESRLTRLGLTNLKEGRRRGDLIQCYKIINGIEQLNLIGNCFKVNQNARELRST